MLRLTSRHANNAESSAVTASAAGTSLTDTAVLQQQPHELVARALHIESTAAGICKTARSMCLASVHTATLFWGLLHLTRVVAEKARWRQQSSTCECNTAQKQQNLAIH
jgi:hypothetical protein